MSIRHLALLAMLIGSVEVSAAAEAPAWLRPAAVPAYGMPITSVIADLPGSRAGLRAGDRVLAVDGIGVHDHGEYVLADALRPSEASTSVWTVARDGAILEVTIPDRDCCPHVGTTCPPMVAPTAAFCRSLGIAIADADLPALADFPRRLVAEADAWFAGDPTRRADPRWFADLVAAWLALARGGDPVMAPGLVPPTPLAARAWAFWRAIAAAGDHEPDLAHADGDAAFYAVFYPYPAAPIPAFGTPALAQPLAALLMRGSVDPEGSRADREQAAMEALNGDDFVGQVRASLLDSDHHGGWPYRSWLVAERPQRAAVVADLRKRVAAGGEEADLAAYALVGPLAKDKDLAGLVEVVTKLGATSPWLAAQALRLTVFADQGLAKRLSAKLAGQPFMVGPPARSGFYRWCLKRNQALRHRYGHLDYQRSDGLPRCFRDEAELVAQALRSDDSLTRSYREVEEICNKLNDIAWAAASDPRLLDGEMATRVAAEMRKLRGSDLDTNWKDTIACAFARVGDLPTALRWQKEATREAIAMGHSQSNFFVQHGASYSDGRPWTEPETATGKARRERIEHDGQIDSGWLIDDVRFGWWRTTAAAGGQLLAEGCWYEGSRLGTWRTWDAAGHALTAGCYRGRGDEQTGPWTTWWPTGMHRESGTYLDGKRSGLWQRWHANGTLAYEATWRKGELVGVAREWNEQGQAAAAAAPLGKPGGASDF